MPAFFPIQTGFSAGELSPRMRGRTDLPLYRLGLARCDNFVPTPQGSLLMRHGTEIVSGETTAGGFIRSLQFKSSSLVRYQVALSDQRLEVFTPSGVLQSFAAELAVNGECNLGGGGWTLTDSASYVGNAPDQYIRLVYPALSVAKQNIAGVAAGTYLLKFRLRDDTWRRTFGTTPLNGPVRVSVGTSDNGTQLHTARYSAVGEYSVQITVAAPSTVYLKFASANLSPAPLACLDVDDLSFRSTASAIYVAAPWKTEDIPQVQYVCETGRERMILVHPLYEPRVLERGTTGVWTFRTISTVGYTVPTAAPGHTVVEWGGASGANNWPSVVEIWQGRLWMAATPAKKNTVWASKPFTYDFTAVDYNALNAGDGFSYDVAVKGEIRWLQGQKVMLCGTDEAEYSISANDGVVYAGNINIAQESAFGSAKIQALYTGDQVVYVSQDRRKVRAMSFSLEGGGWYSKDITFAAEHITAAGIVDMAYARDPFSTLVLCLGDGTLACCNYDRAQNVSGWWTASTSGLEMRSMSVMTRPEGDEVWGVGVVSGHAYLVRWPLYDAGDQYYDLSRTLQSVPGVATGTMAYSSSTGRLTASAAVFQSYDTIFAWEENTLAIPGHKIRVMSPQGYVIYRVDAWVSDTSVSVTRVGGAVYAGDITATADWSVYTQRLNAGKWDSGQVFQSPYADGASVVVVDMDSGVQTLGTVAWDGIIIIDVPSSEGSRTFKVGQGFTATARTLPLEGGNPGGSAQGMKVHRPGVTLRLNDSGLPLVNGEVASPGRNVGDSSASTLRADLTTRYTEDVTAQVLGYTNGGILEITQELPIRTEICALFGSVQMGKV